MSTSGWLFILLIVALALALVVLVSRPRRESLRQDTDKGGPAEPPTGDTYLEIVDGPDVGRRIPLTAERFLIGRHPDNHLEIAGQMVSRRHAMIVKADGEYTLYDQASANGTYINGQRVSERRLQPGDRVQIGPTTLRFTSPTAPIATPPRRTPTPTPLPVDWAQRIPALREYNLSPITEGGAAQVYRGVRAADQTTVAIKVLKQMDPYLRQKFRDEARILQVLDHRHIARAYSFDQLDGMAYIIMEYCAGGTLRERMNGSPLPLPYTVKTLGQTCEALAYAHGFGVVHRDIKPENIMFTADGEVKLVDFGIAKLTGSLTQTEHGIVIGTPSYLSYEQALGARVDPRSDVYSLGVVLFEMLTGRVPFQGTGYEIVRQHLHEPPPHPRDLNPALPPQVEGVILRALEKKRERRFQSALEMAVALGYDLAPVGRPAEPGRAPPSPPGLALRILDGPQKGQALRVLPGTVAVGRNELNPDDLQMSRQHAQITAQGDVWWLVDLNSANGTYHNGRRIFERVVLRMGDEIRLGSTTLRVDE